jgi:hypothetical protein
MVYTHQIGVLMANYGKPGIKFVMFSYVFHGFPNIFKQTHGIPWHAIFGKNT